MNILLWVLFGALAGWIASMLTGTNQSQGAVGNIIVGIIGAVIGGFIMNFLGGSGATGFNLYSLLVAIGGASLVLFVWRQISSS